jgi:uncharacterized protein YjbJ (UPF0337 family)
MTLTDNLDKAAGKVKQAVGDLTGDEKTRAEGKIDERKGEAREDLERAQERADRKAEEVADLERASAH